MDDTDKMTTLSGLESHGGNGNFKGSVFIKSKKYDELSKEAQDDMSYNAGDYLQALQGCIAMAWAEENEADKRKEHVAELVGLFKSAGFNDIHTEVIDSEYCSEACCYKFPWVIVTTIKGRIKLGWRKRVMNLDWSDSDLGIDGREFFKGEDVTTGESYIHCWGKDKAVEYLTKLRTQ